MQQLQHYYSMKGIGKYQTYVRSEIITSNKIITPEDFAFYWAHNNGECDVTVDGVVLKQGDTLDLTSLPYDSIYNVPITIIFGNNSEEKKLCLKQFKFTDK